MNDDETVTSRLDCPPPAPTGYPASPYFYPTLLRRIADALTALNAFGQPDPAGEEGPSFLGATAIQVWDDETTGDDPESAEGLHGWLAMVDRNCWVFVPYLGDVTNGGG